MSLLLVLHRKILIFLPTLLVIPKRVFENLKPLSSFLVRFIIAEFSTRFLGMSKILVSANEGFLEEIHLL